jgi:zinc protease
VTLPNGLDVAIETLTAPGAVPAVGINLRYRVGARDEREGERGMARLAQVLMYRGLHKDGGVSPAGRADFLTLIERAGAQVLSGGANAVTDADRSTYFETVPAGSLAFALWLEADRMKSLAEALDEASFAAARTALKDEVAREEARPFSAQRVVVAESLYPPGHPYHGSGGALRARDLDALTLPRAKAFLASHYAPNRATLAITGGVEAEAALGLVQEHFGGLVPSEPRSRVRSWPATLAEDRVVERGERSGLTKLTLVWHAPEIFHQDEAALDALAGVLAEGADARLAKALGKDRKLASRFTAYLIPGELAGQFYIEAVPTAGTTLETVRDAVLSELATLADAGPDGTELTRVKAARLARFRAESERLGGLGGRADRLTRYLAILGTPLGAAFDLERFNALQAGDLRRVAKAWLTSRHHLEIRFRPELAAVTPGAATAETPPPLVDAEVPPSPSVTTKTLENGLTVVVVPRPGIERLEAAVVIKRGDLAETEGTAGTSWLTAMTLTAGTRGRTREAVAAELAAMGAELTAEGSKFGSAVALSALKRQMEPAVALLADVTRHPDFLESEVELARQARLDQIAAETSAPAQAAAEIFQRTLYSGGKHPGGLSDRGTEASIQGVTVASLKAHHATWWVPGNAALIFTGDVTPSEAESLANRHFGDWRAKELPPAPEIQGVRPSTRQVVLVESPGALQSQIRIGAPVPARPAEPAAHAAVTALIGMLGGSYASRLPAIVAAVTPTGGAAAAVVQNRWFAHWTVSATVDAGATLGAVVAIHKELAGLGTLVDEAALASYRSRVSREAALQLETSGQLLRQAAPLVVSGETADDLYKPIRDLAQTTTTTVQEAAKTWVDPARSLTVIIGDPAVLEKPLQTLGWGEVLVVDARGRVLRRAGEAPARAPDAPEAAESPVPPSTPGGQGSASP